MYKKNDKLDIKKRGALGSFVQLCQGRVVRMMGMSLGITAKTTHRCGPRNIFNMHLCIFKDTEVNVCTHFRVARRMTTWPP